MPGQTKFFIALMGCMLFIMACDNSASNKNSLPVKNDTMKFSITEKPFGKYENDSVIQYTITNPSGMQVSILNYGGTVTGIFVADKNGNKENVVLGYDSFDGYLQTTNPYFGCLVGRVANRIGNAKFSLDGKNYILAANNNGNSLHGGLKGFDKVIWSVEKLPGDSSIQLSYLSKDGEEGYPGNLSVKVIYAVTEDNGLEINYSATTDKATPVNLTNHCYFNLSAGKDSTILDHRLMINADTITDATADLIPTGKLLSVKGTSMDFNVEKQVGKDIGQVTGGYDNNWVIKKQGSGMEKAATVYDRLSGRFMQVFTTEPGIQFYTGNFLDGTLKDTHNGIKYMQHSGLCLETQHFPDSPNQPSFPNTILRPGETYSHKTLYRFSVK